MEIAFELGINVLENGILVDFMHRYFGFRHDAPKRYVCGAIVFVLLLLQISLFNLWTPFNNMGTYIAIAILWIYALTCLQGSAMIQLFVSVLIMTAIMLIASGTNLLFSMIGGYTAKEMISVFGPVRIAAVLLTKVILFYCTRLFLMTKQQESLHRGDLFPLLVIPSLSIVSITFMMKAAFQDPVVQEVVLYAVLCIFAVNLVTYYLFVRLSRESKKTLEFVLLQSQNEHMREKELETNAMYQEIQAFRHDMKNHFLNLDTLLAVGEAKHAREYIMDLFAHETNQTSVLPETGNELLNAILGAKLSLCRKDQIQFTVNIQDDLNWMEPLDLSSLLGNLLDNAIEAGRKADHPTLSLAIVSQGSYTLIAVQNTIHQSVLAHNPNLNTTKHNKRGHGYGVHNIRKVVNKYQGMMDYYEQDQLLCCEIMLLPAETRELAKTNLY